MRRQASEDIRAERLLLEETLPSRRPGSSWPRRRPASSCSLTARVAEILGHDVIETSDIEDYSAYRGFTLDRAPVSPERAALARASNGEVVQDEEVLYETGQGRWVTLRLSAAPISDASGRTVAGVVVFQDISQRVRGERLLASQRDVMAMIARGEALDDTLAEIVTAYERLSDRGGRASILLTTADGSRIKHGAAPSLPAPYNQSIDGLAIGPYVGSCGTAAYRRETVIVTDTQSDPLWADFRELAHEDVVRAGRRPVLRDGALVGTFAMYHDEPVEPSIEEREVVELLSRTAAVAIERDRDVRARERQLSELQSSLASATDAGYRGGGRIRYFPSRDRTLDVGGDFYDLFPLSDHAWGLVIGDVCGHGAQAAAVTALTRHTTRAVAGRERDPREVLRQVSEILRGSRIQAILHGCVRPCRASCPWLAPHALCRRPPASADPTRRWHRRNAGGARSRTGHHAGSALSANRGRDGPRRHAAAVYGWPHRAQPPHRRRARPCAPARISVQRQCRGAPLVQHRTAALGNPRRQPRDDVAMLMLRVPIGGEVDHERPAESADARP